MSIEFAIIPITTSFISTAHEIQTKLTDAIKTNINIQIDTDYTTTITSRINKWKKLEVNIVLIDDNYNESNTITVRFSDKRSKPEVMEIDEFVDLVSSFEDEDVHNIHYARDSDELATDNQTGGCIIM